MRRVAVGGFQHETNTFVDAPTTVRDFEAADGWPGLTRGEAVFAALEGRNIGMAGLLSGARAQGWTVAPLAWCGGGAGGVVSAEAFDRLAEMLLADLAAALPVDGVLLDLHGAMVSENHDDADGAFLARVRGLVGDAVPIVCSLDLHANLSEAMVRLSDALAIYRTYPHLDMAETGERAARLLADLFAGRQIRHKAFQQIPFLIPTTRGRTTAEPAATLYALRTTLARRAGIAELGFACGFSPSDVPHCGPAIVGYGEDAAAVDAAVETLAAAVLAAEADFAEDLASVETAVARAAARARVGDRPVVLADVDDNPGAGERGDGTWLVDALIDQGVENAAIGLLYDPPVVAAAHAAGLGATIDVRFGGGADPAARRRRVVVDALSDGRFRPDGPYFADADLDLGPMAALRCGGVRVVVSSQREQAADLAMFTHLGLDPRALDVLAVKSSVHFRAAFEPIAAEIIEVRAPRREAGGERLYGYRTLREGLRQAPMGAPFRRQADAP